MLKKGWKIGWKHTISDISCSGMRHYKSDDIFCYHFFRMQKRKKKLTERRQWIYCMWQRQHKQTLVRCGHTFNKLRELQDFTGFRNNLRLVPFLSNRLVRCLFYLLKILLVVRQKKKYRCAKPVTKVLHPSLNQQLYDTTQRWSYSFGSDWSKVPKYKITAWGGHCLKIKCRMSTC